MYCTKIEIEETLRITVRLANKALMGRSKAQLGHYLDKMEKLNRELLRHSELEMKYNKAILECIRERGYAYFSYAGSCVL